jgi:hypothetical protein
MWPLPQLPTDHLYKLVTFVGMAMLIGAFYLLDSGRKPFEETGNNTYARMVILVDRLTDVGLSPKPLADDISEEGVYDQYNEYRDLIRTLPLGHSQAIELRDLNEQILMMRIKNRSDYGWQDVRKSDFYSLLFLGMGFLWVGVLWWYLGFQRHQDAIIRLAALEARQRSTSIHAKSEGTGP